MRRNLTILFFLVAVLATCLSIFATQQRETNTFLVCPERCPYSSIQTAINKAEKGDTVQVKPGMYTESISFKGKAITVKSIDPQDTEIVSSTVIKGEERGSVVTFNEGDLSTKGEIKVPFKAIKPNCYGEIEMGKAEFLLSEVGEKCVVESWTESNLSEGETQENDTKTTKDSSSQAVLSGFKITGGTGSLIHFNVPTSSRNEKKALTRTEQLGGGILIKGGNSPTIKNNLIEDNEAYMGGGIFIQSENSEAKIINNTFSKNVAYYGGGIGMEGSSPTVKDNKFIENLGYSKGGGVSMREGSQPLIFRNRFIKNRSHWGSSINFRESNPTIKDNIFISNQDSMHATIQSFASNSNIKGNTFRGNKGAGGGAIHLKYDSSSYISENVFENNFSIYAGGAIRVATYDANPKIRIIDNRFVGNEARRGGGAISIKNSCDLVINDNVFSGNSSPHGGAISMHKGANPKIVSNIFEENNSLHGPGAIEVRNSSPLVDNNTLANNQGAEAGAVTIQGNRSDPRLVNNLIEKNSADMAGGITIQYVDNALIRDNVVKENHGRWRGGGLAIINSSPVIKGNKIKRNTTNRLGGGLILREGSESIVIKNDFENNSADQRGGAIFVGQNSSILNSAKAAISNPGKFNNYKENRPEGVFYESQ